MTQTSNLPIRVRPANQEDVPFIFSSWLKSYRYSGFAKKISNTVYYTEHHKTIEKIVRCNEVYIACNKEEPNQIYGWIAGTRVDHIFVLHYVYVKQLFRRQGIARMLLKDAFDHNPEVASVFTHHMDDIADKLAAKYNMVYSPYLAFNIEENDDAS